MVMTFARVLGKQKHYSGCSDKIAYLCGTNNRNLILIVLEVGKCKNRCWETFFSGDSLFFHGLYIAGFFNSRDTESALGFLLIRAPVLSD